MFRRIVSCGIATLVFVLPAATSGEIRAFAGDIVPSVSAVYEPVIALARDRVDDSAQTVTPVQQTPDGTADQQFAALDPAEISAKPPVPIAPDIQTPQLAEPFGLKLATVEIGGIVAKWNGVEADIRAESAVLTRCRTDMDSCPRAAREFLAVVAQGRALSGRARIGVINRAVNMAIRPMSDLAQWGVIDHWSAPLETFTTGLGDCEDYAIAKYVALIEAGIAPQDVRLVVVRDTAVGEDHAVTAVHLDSGWVVLDNRWLVLVDDRDMRRLLPLFVLDELGVRQPLPGAIPNSRNASAPRGGSSLAPGAVDLHLN